MTVVEKIQAVKKTSSILATISAEDRNQVLRSLAEGLNQQIDRLLAANALDLQAMDKSDPRYDRLLLNKERIQAIAEDVLKVVKLPDPTHQILSQKTLPNGLQLKKISVPLGVIGVIYESRPNVTIDVFALCFKAGNACILKGGKEAAFTNQALIEVINRALLSNQLDPNLVYLMPPEREKVFDLLNAVGMVDVCIPRGSQELINFVRKNAKIPVIETGAGIVHLYFDVSGDLEQGRSIIFNAKTRRVSVCNALDTLIIHQQRLSDLAQLIAPLADKSVEIFADEQSYNAIKNSYPGHLLHHAVSEDFGREFLSYKMSIKTVSSLEEAINHIMHYTSHHSEAIIATNTKTIETFLEQVDAAAVYVNASTAFTDGGEFGMGAEIGISTQKIHARGPMGLDALTSYKWLVYGNGQIR